MFLRAFLFMALAIATTSSVLTPIAVPEVAGLAQIRQAGKQQIIARVEAIKTAFETAVKAAKPCPPTPDFKACQECVRDKCTQRAKDICTTNRYFDAKRVIDQYVDNLIAKDVVPEAPNFDATAAEQKFGDFKSAVTGVATRRKRSPAGSSAPFCDKLRENSSACAFYIPQCSCSLICPAYDKAVAAKKKFEDAVNNYLDFDLKQVSLKLDKFGVPNGFADTEVKIQIGGGERTLSLSQAVLPYDEVKTGTAIANQAVDQF